MIPHLMFSVLIKDEQVICELKSDGSCIQNVTLRGVHNSTFDVVYLYPNDTKSKYFVFRMSEVN